MLLNQTSPHRSFAGADLPAAVDVCRFLPVIVALAFGISCAATAYGQTTFGSVTGVITDPSGAAVPSAQITVVNQDTGFTRDRKSVV